MLAWKLLERPSTQARCSILKLDFIIGSHDEFDEARFARRRRLRLGGFEAWFISPEDLILAKLQWRSATGSEQQLRDVRVLRSSIPDLDNRYVASWAARLGLTDALNEAAPHE